MRRLASFALGAALLLGPPALAQQPPTPASGESTVSGVTVTAPAPPEVEDPVVCRKAPETGSRVRAIKDCRKRSEWAAKSRSRNKGVVEVRLGDCGGSGSGANGCELFPRPR